MTNQKWYSMLLIPMVIMGMLGTTGCPASSVTPAQVAALAATACSAAETVVTIEGGIDPASAAKLQAACSALTTAVANWKSGVGTEATVIEAVNAALAVLAAIAPNSKVTQYVELAVTLFQAIIVLFPPAASAAMEAKAAKPSSAKEKDAMNTISGFKAKWNKMVAADKALKGNKKATVQ